MFFFIAFSFQLTFFFLFLQQLMKQFRVHGVINKPESVEQRGGGVGVGKQILFEIWQVFRGKLNQWGPWKKEFNSSFW